MDGDYTLFPAVATFMLSVVKSSGWPLDSGLEVACCGRSNAGKSSALNALMGHKKLARTGKTPGRTREINFFALDRERQIRLVDLPGYGYARVSKSERESWGGLINAYLRARRSLTGIVLVVDIRRLPQDFDRQILQWCGESSIAPLVLLSKADRLSKSQRINAHRECCKMIPEAKVLAFSSTTKLGLTEARDWLNGQLLVEGGTEA